MAFSGRAGYSWPPPRSRFNIRPMEKTSTSGASGRSQHSPSGLFAYAGQYLEAVKRLEGGGTAVGIPALSCLAQGIELLAKASLLAAGVPEAQLARPPYGHDIEACLEAALERGLRLECSPSAREAVRQLSDLHAAKELHYLFEYEKQLPDAELLAAFAERLQAAVFLQVSAAYWTGAAEAPRAPGTARDITLHLIEDGIAARAHFQVWWALRNRALPEYLDTMNELDHVEFFHASNSGHYKNFFVALSRIFDRDPRTAGMRELRKALAFEGRRDLADYLVAKLRLIEAQVGSVMQIRNKSIAHNDRSIPRDKVYEINGITPDEIRELIDVACTAINHIAGELGLSERIFQGERFERATLNMLRRLKSGASAAGRSAI